MDFFGIDGSEIAAFGGAGGPQIIAPLTVTVSVNATPPIVALISRDTFKRLLDSELDSVFYNTAEFAEDIIYQYRRDNTSQTISVIFDEETQAMSMDTGAPVLAEEPQFHCHSRRFQQTPRKDDRVVIRNRQFIVVDILPDGTGVVVVHLRRA